VLKFLTAVGRPELMGDERFSSYAARAKNPEALYDLIHEVAPGKTTAEWIVLCEAGQIPCMPIVDIEELPQDEHLKAVGLFEPHTHPTEGATRLVRSPIGFSRSPASIRRHAPAFAEHSVEVLREIGFAESEIGALLSGGAVLSPTKKE
jgi:crotonobetainyl-CoA:carnitine CoA-transferase CaiB-like acyl-CoA transferase